MRITGSKARRAKKKQINKKKVFICIILLIAIIGVSSYCIISRNKKPEIAETNNTEQNEVEEPEIVEEQEEIVDVSNIPEKMGNYDVLGQLVIDKIGVDKSILAISEPASLKLSVAKLYGPDLDKPGNFCIDGHNWDNMLKRLSEMEVGDTLYIIDRNTKAKINYKIYNKYIVAPEDISCLDQNEDGKKEITLITCTPGGAKRLICKAREIEA